MANKIKITIDQFGRDHWSLLAYIATRWEGYRGRLDHNHMRCNKRRHPKEAATREAKAWSPEYGTRLRGYPENPANKVEWHDDFDCVQDFKDAELLTSDLRFTDFGMTIYLQLHAFRVRGGNFIDFTPEVLNEA